MTNHTTHTPGPWTIARPRHTGGHWSLCAVVAESGPTIAQHGVPFAHGEAEAEANLRLIAAAPDMLAALHTAAEWVASQGRVPGCAAAAESMGRVIAAAIARAEGR